MIAMRPVGAITGRRFLLGAILLIGTALRFFRLGADSLWYDETVSTYLAGSPVAELIRHTAGDIHPPGYYLLLRGWLLLTGYGSGHADPTGNGLEFAAGFFSLFFGILLIALVYALARRLVGGAVALVAAAFVALSPFNVWYSQEVRMYTLGAVAGVVVLWALSSGIAQKGAFIRHGNWVVYAFAAAAGMYTLYYFAFLLIPLNLWALAAFVRQRRRIKPWIWANVGAMLLYAPWIPVAWRQATQPPVPPWRSAPNLWAALQEGWTALSLGQSTPVWVRPALVLTLVLYVLGMVSAAKRGGWSGRAATGGGCTAAGLVLATAGPFLLILLVSFLTPLYHVRYLFTYSPAFYILLATGLIELGRHWRAVGWVAAIIWLLAAGVTLRAFWFEPAYRADDHRSAVRELLAAWRPGDVVVVNAGWAYTALATYWDGAIGGRYRITGALPEARPDDALVMVTAGHTDGDAKLGWGDPRSDFFAMPAQVAKEQVADLFSRFSRVWHYRIYDTVNDPDGLMRALLVRRGQPVDDHTYLGEAYLRVEAYTLREGATWPNRAPGASYTGGLLARWEPLPAAITSGQTIHSTVIWLPAAPQTTTLRTSLRLVGEDGQTWAQPLDEQPLGPLFPSTQWPTDLAQRQPLALPVPVGTPPGQYSVVLVAYAADTGQPLDPSPANGASEAPPGVLLGRVTVERPSPGPGVRPAAAQFGPVALIEAKTPVTALSPGDEIPVELLWQARTAPSESLVVVLQLLDQTGDVVAGLEAQPLEGRYATQDWQADELVRDRHTLTLPPTLSAGTYRLVVGAYRAADKSRYTTRGGLLTDSSTWMIKSIEVR